MASNSSRNNIQGVLSTKSNNILIFLEVLPRYDDTNPSILTVTNGKLVLNAIYFAV
jgi:hypothetical protein